MDRNERLDFFVDYFSWNLPDYLKEIYEKAVSEHVPVIRKPAQTFFKVLLESKRPERILEIGTAVGFSSLLMAEYTDSGTTVETIEKVPAKIKAAKENFSKYDKNHKITLLEGDAGEVLKNLSLSGKKYDLLFLDAAKGQYPVFLPYIRNMMIPGSVLVTDNCFQDGSIIDSRFEIERRDRTIHERMREYLWEITHDDEFVTCLLKTGDGMAVTVKKHTGTGRR